MSVSPARGTLLCLPTGTRLSLVQPGVKPPQKHNWDGARDGWQVMAGKLVALLARIQ